MNRPHRAAAGRPRRCRRRRPFALLGLDDGLGGAEALDEGLPVGHVEELKHEADRHAAGRSHEGSRELGHERAAVGTQVAPGDAIGAGVAGQALSNEPQIGGEVVGVGQVSDVHPRQHLGSVAEHLAERGVGCDDVAADRHDRHADRRVLHRDVPEVVVLRLTELRCHHVDHPLPVASPNPRYERRRTASGQDRNDRQNHCVDRSIGTGDQVQQVTEAGRRSARMALFARAFPTTRSSSELE